MSTIAPTRQLHPNDPTRAVDNLRIAIDATHRLLQECYPLGYLPFWLYQLLDACQTMSEVPAYQLQLAQQPPRTPLAQAATEAWRSPGDPGTAQANIISLRLPRIPHPDGRGGSRTDPSARSLDRRCAACGRVPSATGHCGCSY